MSKYLTGICLHRCKNTDEYIFTQIDEDLRRKLKKHHLPQGAPSSPSLSNAVLIGLDSRLNGLAKKLGLTYSRYADDFVFSGNTSRNWQAFIALVGAICLSEGFMLNYRKTKLIRSNQKQQITGIVVNEKVNIDRRYYDNLKAIINNCVRHGPHDQNLSDHQNFRQHLLGRIQYVKWLNEDKGRKLELLFSKISWSPV